MAINFMDTDSTKPIKKEARTTFKGIYLQLYLLNAKWINQEDGHYNDSFTEIVLTVS